VPEANVNAAPVEAPKEIKPETGLEQPSVNRGAVGGIEGGIVGGVSGGIVGGLVAAPPPPPPPPPPPAPVRVGGVIKAPTKIKNVDPVYPPIAQSARKEGVVIIELLVGVDGRVKNATILKHEPLLDQAALDAVKQWVYTPTTLNGIPQEVLYNITVAFSLK
jgi:protein TonB